MRLGYPRPVSERRSRPVYETGKGELCPTCGWPVGQCRCSSRGEEPVPARPGCVLRLSRKGRSGKTVTVVDALPQNSDFLSSLASELKRACGSGGTVASGSIEIQGDQRERLRSLLRSRGLAVRG
ncbi:MAG TPA: hypothetical protein VEQ10_20480 [Vicinamibacteria bacterium]|nr:hypothetical protein [Vicinamibacteria bacterium]